VRWNLGEILREPSLTPGTGEFCILFKSILYVDLLYEIRHASF